jgi:quercetin dioxygenase-like cupin family protein
MVVQIEGARTNPSIGTLCRLAEAFGVSVAGLLESTVEPPVRVIGADEPPLLWRGPAGGAARLLCAGREVELWDWRMAPGERHTSVEHSPGTRELVHVQAGCLVVTVEGADHRVAAGETVDFAADRPHGYRNDGDVTLVLTMVVVMAPGEWDRRRRS